mmetsp:Transcript_37763/g.106712  ORF Transcript_37763/g.106712 Transcript_37763/m.106712 type:complete len:314 (+) Transcript_37763:674-1615(+)
MATSVSRCRADSSLEASSSWRRRASPFAHISSSCLSLAATAASMELTAVPTSWRTSMLSFCFPPLLEDSTASSSLAWSTTAAADSSYRREPSPPATPMLAKVSVWLFAVAMRRRPRAWVSASQCPTKASFSRACSSLRLSSSPTKAAFSSWCCCRIASSSASARLHCLENTPFSACHCCSSSCTSSSWFDCCVFSSTFAICSSRTRRSLSPLNSLSSWSLSRTVLKRSSRRDSRSESSWSRCLSSAADDCSLECCLSISCCFWRNIISSCSASCRRASASSLFSFSRARMMAMLRSCSRLMLSCSCAISRSLA